MKIFIGQIYIKPGICYPFSFHFQKWLATELTKCVVPSEPFKLSYPGGFDLGFRISAKTDIDQPEIKGPTVFKRDKKIEFTIFLPFLEPTGNNQKDYREIMHMILGSIISTLITLKIETKTIESIVPDIIEHFLSTPAMFKN